MTAPRVVIGLSAVVLAVTEEAPYVLVTRGADRDPALPFGPFDPAGDRTLELSLRRWVTGQTGFEIGYVEQLYTFGDRGRETPLPDMDDPPDRVISVGYLALTPERAALDGADARWRDWYRFFPWEDWRAGRPAVIEDRIGPALQAWADDAEGAEQRTQRRARARLAFALEGAAWNEERALDRYELLYEARLVPEAARDRTRFLDFNREPNSEAMPEDFGGGAETTAPVAAANALTGGLGEPMVADHRRILATAIGRLRGKLKYRPIVFELMPERFTLLRLQRVVEAIAGLELHKQNFRRLLDRTGLVEGTGALEARTGGRPAELFRFRRAVLDERAASGVHVPTPRRTDDLT